MNKKKKLSNFFIDKKIQINVKKKTNIILSKKKIICIIDYRIDNRFKITNYTKYIYIINIYK
jgi:tRNA(Ile)-lysidine synthase